MNLVLAFLGVAILPTILGFLVVSIVEGKLPVLSTIEKLALGFLSGCTILTYGTFMANALLGVPFSLVGFVGTWLLLTVAAGVAAFILKVNILAEYRAKVVSGSPLWAQVLVWIFAASVVVRLVTGGLVAATTPPYFDDTLNNWNLRAKVYYHTQEYTLMLPTQKPNEKPSALSAYPPMLPLAKTFSATLAGRWSDGVANSIQVLWFVAVLMLVYAALRRSTNSMWSLLGASALASLPLFLMQGVNAYSDIAMAAHIFAALALLFHALRSEEKVERLTLVHLSLFMAALFPFVKNEGLVLYLPAYIFFLAWSAWHLLRTGRVTLQDIARCIGFFALCGAILVLPWLIFKWSNGMAFGNAKEIGSLQFGWQQGVLLVVAVNAFFEGNWNLFMPLLLIMLGWQWKTAFRFPLLPLTLFFLLVWFQQILLFLFTNLSYEAVYQTGYGRGLIHLMPVMVTVVTLLLVHTVDRERTTL